MTLERTNVTIRVRWYQDPCSLYATNYSVGLGPCMYVGSVFGRYLAFSLDIVLGWL
jgi:hypothetical protein